MRLVLIFGLLVLAACGRPLSPSETAYLQAIAGDALDTGRMRLVEGHPLGAVTYQIPVRPRVTCQERIWPPADGARTVTVAPAASVVFNTILFRSDLYREDFMAGLPDEVNLLDAMLLAHEAVHVWQWQNRARTGYHPLRAVGEHARLADPYLFDPDSDDRRFLDYGFEQQGALVEEYVCCRLLDPHAPRTARLRALVGQELPVARLDGLIAAPRVRLPWAGAETDGICRAVPPS